MVLMAVLCGPALTAPALRTTLIEGQTDTHSQTLAVK
jgi:hypothetical protein